ncbi:MAG: transglutaminase family protein, partial [Candidatus Thorarchaeota archaeon]
MSAEGTTRKRMGITALLSSIFIVASLVWGIYSFVLIQSGSVRQHDPHFQYDNIDYWPYTNDFAGRDSNWFDNLNYTDLRLNETLPEDLLERMNDPIFYVAPADPGQLWRIESFDQYDGASWTKTLTDRQLLETGVELIPLSEANNTVYSIFFNATAGAGVGTMSLPTLFPSIRVIEDSFQTYSLQGDVYVPDVPSRLLHYDLETDDYGTLLFSPLIDGITGEDVLVSYQVTFVNQDVDQVQTDALPSTIANIYTDLSLVEPLTQRVTDNTSQFIGVGSNAYETAIAVQAYFQSTFTLNITVEALLDRPSGQEVTDWFLERGNGLPQDFATAYCVFMRDLGIPARMVSGYALGEPHPTADMRTLMVRHMAFWSEVFIPMSGHPDGGEWIQVIPAPLPDYMGGGEDPENVPVPDIYLTVTPTSGLVYATIGTPFSLSAFVTVDGVLVTTPDVITFYDVTDAVMMGTAVIGDSFPAIANITYTFPNDATVDFHIITATWTNPYFQVWNSTQIYAVGTPVPLASEVPSSAPPDIVPPATHDVNISQGLDTHVAYWEDTIHVYGVMSTGAGPVNSSLYGNKYIDIVWDETVVGSAFIDEYGYYEYDIYVDPLDLALMKVGPHEIWSNYTGDWNPDYGGFWQLLPAASALNSTVTVWGRIGFGLSVTPSPVSAGGTLYYDGTISFLNGTLIPAGQSVTTFFGSQANSSRLVNTTGGFSWTYVIPAAQSEGFYIARANWTSPWPLIAGNWSISINITVSVGGSQILLNPLSDPVFIGETYTISGYLQHISNGSGIGSQTVQVYWNASSVINIGSDITAADGYFEVSYQIPIGYEGPVTYWANFSSPLPELADSESLHLGTFAKKYDVDITISVTPDPINLLQTVTIQGIATLPENSSSPLSVEMLEVYWSNSTTGPNGVLIGTTWTNAFGAYAFYFQIPISHEVGTVNVWVNFTSPYTNIDDGGSTHEPLVIELPQTLITVNSDASSYYLNDTVQITGHLQFDNGTSIPFERVFIHWINGSGTWVFEKFTDINGDYAFQYNLSTNMAIGFIDVQVNWTDTSGLYADAENTSLAPPIQLIKYDLEIVANTPNQVFIDESIIIEGNLTYVGGAPPLVGELVEFAWFNTSYQWEVLG